MGSRSCRRMVRRGAVVTLLTAAVAAVAAGVWLTVSTETRGEVRAAKRPSLTARVCRRVKVHRGEQARIAYRVDALAATASTATVDLVVRAADGGVVRRLVDGRVVATGSVRVWKGKMTLPPGEYRIEVRAVDAAGVAAKRAVSRPLRVLEALPPLVPSAAALERALAWAAERDGDVTVAVVDSRGELHGLRATEHRQSASVVKAMLLVAYLRSHDSIAADMRDTLTAMIERSDNNATAVVYGIVGREGLVKLARVTGMRDFEPYGGWITTRITAADMARFFRDMEHYIPDRHLDFANELLSGIVSYQRWGIPPAAEPLGYHVYFKGGWLGAYILANQAARLERGKVRLGLAVFTEGNPSSSYGLETIQGVAERLLAR